MRAFLLRLACVLGCHSWRYFPPPPAESPADCLGRRTCVRCGVWEEEVPGCSGMAGDAWVRF